MLPVALGSWYVYLNFAYSETGSNSRHNKVYLPVIGWDPQKQWDKDACESVSLREIPGRGGEEMAKRHQEGRGSKPTKGPVSRKVLKVSSADSIRLRVDPVGHERA